MLRWHSSATAIQKHCVANNIDHSTRGRLGTNAILVPSYDHRILRFLRNPVPSMLNATTGSCCPRDMDLDGAYLAVVGEKSAKKSQTRGSAGLTDKGPRHTRTGGRPLYMHDAGPRRLCNGPWRGATSRATRFASRQRMKRGDGLSIFFAIRCSRALGSWGESLKRKQAARRGRVTQQAAVTHSLPRLMRPRASS